MTTILLTGDVMLGRGIDQILGQPSSPEIHERFCKSALDYVALAEARNGPIPRVVDPAYVWGDSLAVLRRANLRIVNLETAATCCHEPAPKGINYRCHPANLSSLTAASIHCCVLSNNHVLDWGEAGLVETLDALDAARIAYAGAGRNADQAEAPAALPVPGGSRALVHALGAPSSGIPPSWAAAPDRPGIRLLDEPDEALDTLSEQIAADARPGDVAIVSIHWGPNWGYDVPEEHRSFAHRLIDEAGVDVVHGHSSHHPMAIEIYRGRPIFYGCGDFLNDYEGIRGHESYRPDLVLAYQLTVGPDGSCVELELLPFRIARFRLNRATLEEAEWLAALMDRECRRFGGRVGLNPATLELRVTTAAEAIA